MKRAELPIFERVPEGTQPPYLYPDYRSSVKRAPTRPLISLQPTFSERSGPVFGHAPVAETDSDLTAQHSGAPIGERIVVSGRVLDEDGRPVRGALIEVWQANAAGRYRHKNDQHAAPLDANFTGWGRALSDAEGRYKFLTIKPGAYPWANHHNAWRPAHIHFSLFGSGLLSRLVTQMYFPGDPLLAFDPIYNGVPDEGARRRLISLFDWEHTTPDHALGYRFDIVLRGRNATPAEK
ncbi:MAG TPA: protocatechuate 3,4-dioxygenase subunit beta [Dongiaceae bacterium]|nr:protocatechuate 3,4-dioxygenase subunit beta [Dongiaceae bacterium]